jgi:hypothetical protein
VKWSDLHQFQKGQLQIGGQIPGRSRITFELYEISEVDPERMGEHQSLTFGEGTVFVKHAPYDSVTRELQWVPSEALELQPD